MKVYIRETLLLRIIYEPRFCYNKILNISACQKRPRQTAQTQIRLLLEQSDQGLPGLLF